MLVAVFTMAACSMACEKEPEAVVAPPPEVYVAQVIQKDVPVYLELVGQAAGFQDVEIRARVEGFLETVNFREGSFVRTGSLLYQIDRKPLEAILAASKAEQATAEAVLQKANNDVARYTPLVAKQAVSKQELDNALADQDAARAQVEATKAAVEKATFDLGYTRISSPIAGLVGTTEVKSGNLVGRGESTLLTTISQIDPILFNVGVTEADYLRVARREASRGRGAEWRCAAPRRDSADARRRHHLSAYRSHQLRRAGGRPDHRHPRARAGVSQSRFPAAAGSVPARRGCCSRPSREHCSFRSVPCRSSRISTASRWWTTPARWRFAT